jgi:LmbE family N-acetylglucosaminyl deacetylase
MLKRRDAMTTQRKRAGWMMAGWWVLTTVLVLHAAALRAQGGDDKYRFAAGASEERSVELQAVAGGADLRWSNKPDAAWDTALLGVRVRADKPEPFVELSAGAVHIAQYLDAGAHGLRWLNLSKLRPALQQGVTISLRVHGVVIEPGAALLRSFVNPLQVIDRPILILAPHPDDAEIAAFGLYASHSRNTTIVTVTSGNAGDANYQDAFGQDAAAQYMWKGYLRAVDSVTVPWQGGVPPERCFNLGYFDARLAQMHATPAVAISELYGPNQDVAPYRRANIGHLLSNGPRTNTWAHLIEDLVAVLRKVKPALIVMPHPGLDTHLDHQFVAVAAAEALERWKQPVTFLLYTNHASENLYPFGPAGSVVSLPPWAGSEISVQRVFSLPLSAELQRSKLFALETMHDLRLSPKEQSTCATVAKAGSPPRPDYPRTPSTDYFRRGPRSEETFFVYSRAAMRELIDAFLGSAKQTR